VQYWIFFINPGKNCILWGEASRTTFKGGLLAKATCKSTSAFWLWFGRFPPKANEYIEMALNDDNPNPGFNGIRKARLKEGQFGKYLSPTQ